MKSLLLALLLAATALARDSNYLRFLQSDITNTTIDPSNNTPLPTNQTETEVPIIEEPPVPDEDLIHVHFICHSHDDVGWLKTAVDYYD